MKLLDAYPALASYRKRIASLPEVMLFAVGSPSDAERRCWSLII
jgi:hypothetical protein